MRIFCCVFVVSLMSVGNYVVAQPVATDFSLPVQPASDYYNAGVFLSVYQGKYHMGEDWNGKGKGSSDYGDPVYPMAVGKVVKVLNPTQKGSVGKVVVVKHLLPDGQVIYSYYFHLSKILVSVNQIVLPGKPLGQIGDANGYYKGAAHLHFELRWVNQAMSSSYAPTLLIATEQKYLDPSLFIDDRANKVTINLSANTWFRSKDEGIEIPDYAPAALSYVTCNGQTRSLFSAVEAGWIDPSIRIDRSSLDGGTWGDDIIFGPDINFSVKSFQNCALTIVIPGYNFQASRARDDMIKAADRAGFTRVKLGTLTNLGNDGTGFYYLRSLCFDNGSNTGVGCLIQATAYDGPLLRYIIWYEPATQTAIGDWIELDPNDID